MCNGIVMKEARIVIPSSTRGDILKKLHTGHWGVERTRRRARDTVFWPGISTDIKRMIENCEPCSKNQNSNPKENIMMHQVPESPFEKIGTDLFYYKGKEYLIVADYYSKFWDVARLEDTKSSTIIRKLSLPNLEYGPQYTSDEYRRFAEEWNFHHVTSSPMYPESNGFAERMVQTAKKQMKV